MAEAPLLSWDIFLMSMYQSKTESNDIITIKSIAKNGKWYKPAVSVEEKFRFDNKVVVITDANLKIQFATENMFYLNGYKLDEVVGKSPKMFQGGGSEIESRRIIKMAVESKLPFDTVMTNYRKNGTVYKCHIKGYPIFNKKGELVNYVALENVA